MPNGIVAIYDSDVGYLHHLSEYLRLRDDFPYDIVTFSDLNTFDKFSQKYIDIFITSFIPDFINEKQIGDVFILTVDDVPTYNDYTCLFKYQPADILLRTIMENVSSNTLIHPKYSNTNCSIIGVYSPVNRCGKTGLSISLGLALSKSASTLLISFDTFSIIRDFITDNTFRDISDLLFYFNEDDTSIKNKILSLSYKYFDLNFICPPATPTRIKTTDATTWVRLIKAIADTGLYDNIVIDISDIFSTTEDFFKLCDIIYMPQLNDYVSSRKIDSFFEYFSHISNLDEKLFCKVNLPLTSGSLSKDEFLNQLSFGELAAVSQNLTSDFAKSKGEFHENTFGL